MPAVAEVNFKATNSQQVVTAFKSVGTAASDSATKVQQNSNAMKTMGQGMKTSVSSIAMVGTAFATLSLSVVNTWRAYRDLGDAQLAVDKANTRLAKGEERLNDLKKKAADLQKKAAKGGLEDQRLNIDVAKAKEALAKAEKTYGKNSLEAADARLKVNELQAAGSKTGGELEQVLKDIALQEETVANQTFAASEAQERFNDTQQDFYLSILPTALSGIASLSLAMSGLKGVFTGGGGLIGMIGPIGLAIAGISVAILAFQTNFLGLRDTVGGLVQWFKDRFGAWKDTLQEVFGFIQKGDWGGAFNRIKQAAVAFWNDLVRTVPFFGGVNKVVHAIRNGKWDTAFNIIRDAALAFWADLKQKVPFFAGAETFFRQLFAGDFSGAWNTLKNGVLTAWDAIVKAVPLFGDIATFLRTKFELANATAKNALSQLARDIQPSITLIQQGLAKLGGGDVVGGFGMIGEGVKKGIDTAKNALNNWTKTNFGIDIVALETQANSIGLKILTAISSGLTTIAHVVDPLVASLFKAETWTSALTAAWGAIQTVGNTIITFLVGAISGAASDPKGVGTFWSNIGKSIWDGIVGWMEANLPDTTKALQTFAQGFVDAVESTKRWFQIGGMSVWNAFLGGIKEGMLKATTEGSIFGPALFKIMGVDIEKLKNDPGFQKLWTFDIQAEINKQKLADEAARSKKTIEATKPQIPVTANTSKAAQGINKLRQAASKPVTMTIIPRLGGSIPIPGSRFRMQHGGEKIVRRPTAFIAGEGGRPERVRVDNIGSASDHAGRTGSGSSHITISFEPAEFSQFLRYHINDNSGVMK